MFSRWTWSKLSETKSRLLSSFVDRYALCENEFSKQAQEASKTPDFGLPMTITVPTLNEPYLGRIGITTPLCVLSQVGHSSAIVAQANNKLVDLFTPLRADTQLSFHDMDSVFGKQTLWHSAAHVLGYALELYYQDKGGVSLADGPPLLEHQSGGFYYDFLPSSCSVDASDVEHILKLCRRIISEKHRFEKLTISRAFAKQLFSTNAIKLQLIERIPEDVPISVYRCGQFVDLCRGPHIHHTGVLKSFELTSHAASVWQSKDGTAMQLQRIYGIAFDSADGLQTWNALREEALKRDHKLIGKQQKLFVFSDYSPGSAFFLPMGTRIYNTLVSYIRDKYLAYGFDEVLTPLLFYSSLWKKSGHWDFYRENMFFANAGLAEPTCCGSDHDDALALKPMNCPAHCIMFASSSRSWRELPIKYADFSPLHRNETSGSLKGLTRLRKFAQDDAHIFCRFDQVKPVILECLKFLNEVYQELRFQYRVVVSTRPDLYLGSIEKWNEAEKWLCQCLDELSIPFQINWKDGAFYGPKIDVMIKDALGREHQCGTIQLDFQLPMRFNLEFRNRDNLPEVPVLIHRAMLGSIERIFGILTEHTAGRWPFWLSPRQVVICTVTPDCIDYAQSIKTTIEKHGFYAEANFSDDTIEKKVRRAQMECFNYSLIIGRKEMRASSVSVRMRETSKIAEKKLDELLEELSCKKKNFE